MKRLLSLVAGTVLSLSICQAALSVFYISQGNPGAGPNLGTVYTYELDIDDGTTVRKNLDYFILYDFGPILGRNVGSFIAPDWQIVSLAGLGDIPPGQTPFDDPLIGNVQVRYVGNEDLVGPKFTGLDDFVFSFESPIPLLKNGVENAGSSYLLTKDPDGDPLVPPVRTGLIFDLAGPDAVAEVPEPGSFAIYGVGLTGILIGLLRRKQFIRG